MAEPGLLDTDSRAKPAPAVVSTVALEAAAQGAGSGGEGASTSVPVVWDASRMGQHLVITAGDSAGSQGRGAVWLFSSTGAPAAVPAEGTGSLSYGSYGSQRPASIVTSHPSQGHNWLQVASKSHFGLQEPRE